MYRVFLIWFRGDSDHCQHWAEIVANICDGFRRSFFEHCGTIYRNNSCCLASSSSMPKMEAVCSSETSLRFWACFIPQVKKVTLSLCLTNYALRREGVWWSGCWDPHFLNLDTRWRWVDRFTSRLLYSGAHYIGGWSGCRREDNLLFSPRESNPWFLGRLTSSLVLIPTELFLLPDWKISYSL
jgi:hypothetical protein